MPEYPSLDEILNDLNNQVTTEEPENNVIKEENKQEKPKKIDKIKDWFHGVFSYQRP